ncbi:Uncharacterized protein OBRU01_08610, partial [Operophtera brumata]
MECGLDLKTRSYIMFPSKCALAAYSDIRPNPAKILHQESNGNKTDVRGVLPSVLPKPLPTCVWSVQISRLCVQDLQ